MRFAILSDNEWFQASPIDIWIFLPSMLCQFRQAIFYSTRKTMQWLQILVFWESFLGLWNISEGWINMYVVMCLQVVKNLTWLRRSSNLQDASRQQELGEATYIWCVCFLRPKTRLYFLSWTISRWEKGLFVGDENIAVENLRRFFDQHFHESNDS